MNENFATVLEMVADLRPDRLAISHGDRTRTWAEFDERASRLAGHLAARGIGPESRVAIAQYNGIEYLESVFATLKLRAVPVNVNYRYRRDELVHLLDDARAEAVLFDASLTERFGVARTALPRLGTLIHAGDGECPKWTIGYEDAIAAATPDPRRDRDVNDHWLTYTGGTTGKPKGVLVRHDRLFRLTWGALGHVLGAPPPDLAGLEDSLEDRGVMVCLSAPPLMHASGMYSALGALVRGGRLVLLPSKSYDPDELAATVERERVDAVSIVGDVFARPLADALDAAEARDRPYDVSSLERMLSVGLTWSADVKERLLRHADMVCRDTVACSEGGPFAVQDTRRGEATTTSRFTLWPGARIIDDAGNDVVPGSGRIGWLAAPAYEHVRYQGDDAATSRTFRVFDGQRWVVPGDMGSIEADGTVVFHGRGSRVINTGGEKVHAEEVEQALLTHPAVRDAMVVGTPDDRFGSRIVAVVALRPGTTLTDDEARAHVGARLADHKRPRALVVVDELERSPAGKADLNWASDVARSTTQNVQEIP
jgi:3-oxocholest-4-en-26-oate---CoA ligase